MFLNWRLAGKYLKNRLIYVILRGTRLWFDCNSLILFLEVRSDYGRGCKFYNRSPAHFKIDLNAVICMMHDLIHSFLDNGVMTTPKRRILSFNFTVLCFISFNTSFRFYLKKYCIEINQLIYSVVFHVTIHQPIAMLHLSVYNCFEKGGRFLKKLWCCVGGSITR